MMFFLSHNHKNKTWVRHFYNFLISQDLSVFFDDESIEYGENIPLAIGEGIRLSEHIILIITPDSLSSSWVALEVSTGTYLEPNSKKKEDYSDCAGASQCRKYCALYLST